MPEADLRSWYNLHVDTKPYFRHAVTPTTLDMLLALSFRVPSWPTVAYQCRSWRPTPRGLLWWQTADDSMRKWDPPLKYQVRVYQRTNAHKAPRHSLG